MRRDVPAVLLYHEWRPSEKGGHAGAACGFVLGMAAMPCGGAWLSLL
jgi:hypothetical protein